MGWDNEGEDDVALLHEADSQLEELSFLVSNFDLSDS